MGVGGCVHANPLGSRAVMSPRPRRDSRAAGPRQESPRGKISLGGTSVRDRALRLLGRREHSRTELAGKLARHGHLKDEVDKVLDALEQSGLQSDTRYTTSQVRTRSGREGNRLLRQRLCRQGIGEDMVADALGQLPVESERLALMLARDQDSLGDPATRRRLINRCLRRGFSWDEIRVALRSLRSS